MQLYDETSKKRAIKVINGLWVQDNSFLILTVPTSSFVLDSIAH